MSTLTLPAPASFDTTALFRIILRRWKLVFTTSLLVFAVLAASIFSLTPLYIAQSTIMIDQRESKIVSFQQVLSAMPVDLEAVQSEVQVLQSRQLAEQVVNKLDLVEREEFNPTLDHGFVSQAKAWISQVLGFSQPSLSPEMIHSQAVDILQRKLTVDPLGRSRAISVAIRTTNAELSANIVNSLVDAYVSGQLQTKLSVSRKATKFLADQAEDMRLQVQRGEAAIANFKQSAGLYEGTKSSLLVQQQLSDAVQALDVAKIKRDELAVLAKQAADPATRASLPQVVANPTIAKLEEQMVSFKASALQAEASSGALNARAVQLREAANEAQRQRDWWIGTVAASVASEAAAQSLKVAALEATVAWLKQVLGKSYDAEVKMQALQREADVARGLLNTVLTRLQEVGVGEVLQQADAKVLSRAAVPLVPSFPKTNLFLGLAGLIGISSGCGLALLVNSKGSDRLRSVGDFSPTVRALGLVPQLPRRIAASQYILDRPRSPFAESLRMVLVSILPQGSAPKALLIASAVPDEGKSSTAIALARLAANMGLRTLLVDADLRRPTLHQSVADLREAGLGEVLAAVRAPMEVVQRDDMTSLSLVTAGGAVADPVRMLSSRALQSAVEKWREHFDLIVVDSPPTVPVVDARLIARACDEVLFVAKWNRTHKAMVNAEIKSLQEEGVSVAGVVLTQVDMRRHALDTFESAEAFYGNREY